ncbi:hypothetical protein Pcinc_034877 [Petrolisthes cinctipes]|uniref:Uncharacterized protein n=1 Tax=Petrolisthes cinctipes TaxID=88211 RepID=A0AAE1C0T4_PETCI|nr:hypothetical protein Pcinc_034877 [Petrolisthes cinctipes]
MADSRSDAFKTPGIRLLIRLPPSRNANTVDAAQVYRATAGTDVLTEHLHACSARSSILTKGTTFSLSLSPNHCDTRTFPHPSIMPKMPKNGKKCGVVLVQQFD